MRMTKKRVKELIYLHNLSDNELIGGTTISNEDFQAYLNGYDVLTQYQEQEVFKRALKIDLEERNIVWSGTKELEIPLTKLIKNVDIIDGVFRMWLTGKRNIPYEKEKKIYANYDRIKEAFEKIK